MTKPIDDFAGVARHDQAALDQQALGEALLQQPRLQAVTTGRRVTEAELLDRLRADVALGELLARTGAGGTGELLAEVVSGHLVNFQQRLAQTGVAPAGFVITALASLGQGDAKLLREHLDGVLEADLLVKLEELEHVAADAAPEAMEEPFLGIHVERGRLFRMERTEAFVRGARALQRNVLLHDLHDVRLQAKIVNKLLRKQPHKTVGKLVS